MLRDEVVVGNHNCLGEPGGPTAKESRSRCCSGGLEIIEPDPIGLAELGQLLP